MIDRGPTITDPVAKKRMEHQRLRWRLMYGLGDEDIRERLVLAIGNVRRELWGPIDMTSNPYLHTWSTAAALYSSEPVVIPPAGVDQSTPDLIADMGWWRQMQRVQRDALAFREMPVRIDFEDGEIALQPVPPFLIEVVASPRRPSVPRAILEWTPDPDEPGKWVQRQYDADPAYPTYTVVDQNGLDVTERVLGGSFSGERYPWMTADGPILPWVTYRAQETGWYWDSFSGREVVEGTLQLGVLYSYYSHLLRAASWSQRWALGVEPVGGTSVEGGQTTEVVTDPASLVILRQQEDSTGASVGQWQPAADPEKVLASIQSYERRLVDMALGSVQVSRATSDIRSGYSLAVSREDQRQLQRSFEPLFRATDLELIGKVSALLGGPSKGWRIHYTAIPKDPVEAAAELERITKQVELGLLDIVSAYMELHPGITEEEAEQAVQAIDETNRRMRAQ